MASLPVVPRRGGAGGRATKTRRKKVQRNYTSTNTGAREFRDQLVAERDENERLYSEVEAEQKKLEEAKEEITLGWYAHAIPEKDHALGTRTSTAALHSVSLMRSRSWDPRTHNHATNIDPGL